MPVNARQRKVEIHDFSEIRDIILKQKQVLESIQKSPFELKQSAIKSGTEFDVLAGSFQMKQKDLKSIQQSLLDLKQSATYNRIGPDDLSKDVLYSEKENKNKLTNGYQSEELSENESVINWTAPL